MVLLWVQTGSNKLVGEYVLTNMLVADELLQVHMH